MFNLNVNTTNMILRNCSGGRRHNIHSVGERPSKFHSWTYDEMEQSIFTFRTAHMSNTLDLSRVVFARGRIESDRDRNRKWVQGTWSVVPEVRGQRERGGLKSWQTDSIGSDGDGSSWQESIGLPGSQFAQDIENISQPWGETSALLMEYTSYKTFLVV